MKLVGKDVDELGINGTKKREDKIGFTMLKTILKTLSIL